MWHELSLESSPEEEKNDILRSQTSFVELLKPLHLYRVVSLEDADEVKIKLDDKIKGSRGVHIPPLKNPSHLDVRNERIDTDSPIHAHKTKKRVEVTEVEYIPIPDPSTMVIFSPFASVSFNHLAYVLCEVINKDSAIGRFAKRLIANTLLCYIIYDGLSRGDFFVDWNQPRSKIATLFGFGALNLIASIPLGDCTGYSSILGCTPDDFAFAAGAVSFVSLLLLYSKSATRFSNDKKANMIKLVGEKITNAYSRQAYLEEVAALSRDEIDNFSNIIESNENDDFNGIMRKLKPKGANDQF
jgi:hypothetical protein